MGKYLAIFNGAATDEARANITPEESNAFVTRWGEWAGALGAALIDPGAPLFRKLRLTADAIQPFEDSKTAYAIVEAASHHPAAEMFSTHPHLSLESPATKELGRQSILKDRADSTWRRRSGLFSGVLVPGNSIEILECPAPPV